MTDIGCRFIVEPAGTSLTKLEKDQIAELQPAGFMLRSRNFKGTQASGVKADYSEMLSSLSALLSELREAAKRERILIALDHEGGRVIRPPLPIPVPYAAR